MMLNKPTRIIFRNAFRAKVRWETQSEFKCQHQEKGLPSKSTLQAKDKRKHYQTNLFDTVTYSVNTMMTNCPHLVNDWQPITVPPSNKRLDLLASYCATAEPFVIPATNKYTLASLALKYTNFTGNNHKVTVQDLLDVNLHLSTYGGGQFLELDEYIFIPPCSAAVPPAPVPTPGCGYDYHVEDFGKGHVKSSGSLPFLQSLSTPLVSHTQVPRQPPSRRRHLQGVLGPEAYHVCYLMLFPCVQIEVFYAALAMLVYFTCKHWVWVVFAPDHTKHMSYFVWKES